MVRKNKMFVFIVTIILSIAFSNINPMLCFCFDVKPCSPVITNWSSASSSSNEKVAHRVCS
jgi:hypothetical protein